MENEREKSQKLENEDRQKLRIEHKQLKQTKEESEVRDSQITFLQLKFFYHSLLSVFISYLISNESYYHCFSVHNLIFIHIFTSQKTV